jgi:outer membrane lipoprotein SlyB
MQLEFYGYGISRTMLACAGMGATMGMLVGGTTFGVPTAIVAAVIGAIGGGVLGRFIEWKGQHSGLPSKRRRGSGQTRHYVARSIPERALRLENSDLGNQAGTSATKAAPS